MRGRFSLFGNDSSVVDQPSASSAPVEDPNPSTPPEPAVRYVARQPILDLSGKTFGYELFYRSPGATKFDSSDPDLATVHVIDAAMLAGVTRVGNAAKVFVNCTEMNLLQRHISHLPAESTVVEILETVVPTPEVIEVCRTLHEAGYAIALDDFVPSPDAAPLLALANIVKIDIPSTPPDTVKDLKAHHPALRFVAEKVETRDQFQAYRFAGCELFQGYYFCTPEVIAVRHVPARDYSCMRALQLATQSTIDMVALEQVVKSDPGLCFRLLSCVNSLAYAPRTEVRSVLGALLMMGEREIRRWLLLSTLASRTQNKPEALLGSCLLRARFCELLATLVHLPANDLFLTGLFSLFDVVLELPKEEIVNSVALPREVARALLGEGTLGQCVALVEAYERGAWERFEKLSSALRIPPQQLPLVYRDSLQWVDQILSMERHLGIR